MTYRPGKHVYLAAGFFTDKQKELCDFIEGLESTWQPIYSPRKDGGVLKPNSPTKTIKATFDDNCLCIGTASWVLAVIDDYDPGVIWEMGYAYAKDRPMLAYSDVPGRGLNVMLAGSCRLGFVNGRDDLRKIFDTIENRPELRPFPHNTWSGEIQ